MRLSSSCFRLCYTRLVIGVCDQQPLDTSDAFANLAPVRRILRPNDARSVG